MSSNMTRSPYVHFAPIHGGAFALGSSSGQPTYGFSSAQTLPFPSDNNASSSDPKAAFRAPAHKHAHHLHSIPPREKSTRTLIIDHMLWVHARTRFAQARAELAMTDRTGGPTSLNYAHRERPENYEEDEEVLSEGEDVAGLYAREGGPEELRKQDLALARSLRLRAEGLEKVVTSMLDQPPTIHPMTDEDLLTPPTSPKLQSGSRDPAHPHTLPNGVRLRLALSTVVNDLFARQAAPPPFRQQMQCSSTTSTSSVPNLSHSALPDALLPLSTVSASSASGQPMSETNYVAQTSSTIRQQASTASSHTLALYLSGADPSTANSPPAFRCPRHLYPACEICVEAKSGAGAGRSTGMKYGMESTAHLGTGSGGGISGWQDGSGIGSGLARPAVGGSVLRRTPPMLGGDRAATSSGNTKLSELIPRFMRLSALVATELGSEAREDETSSPEPAWGNDRTPGQEQGQQGGGSSPLSGPPTVTPNQNRIYPYTLQPSREWYLLLAGLLTRAVLEGYLTAGWRGPEAAECLLTVGLGIHPEDKASDSGTRSGDNDSEDLGDEFEEFDPDELPSLKDAARILFPALRAGTPPRTDSAEAEYGIEMDARFRNFLDISPSTSDLSAHMEHLAWQYHAEPVERAAARFCESIAKWRGKPELETYKKRPPRQSADTDAPGGSTMTIDSLVHSSPITPSANITDEANARRPPIEKYFTQPSVARESGWHRTKRRRSTDEGNSRAGKKPQGYVKPLGNA